MASRWYDRHFSVYYIPIYTGTHLQLYNCICCMFKKAIRRDFIGVKYSSGFCS
ncbi:hypothetical protein FA13DRAFT_812945 [Coprinellus micaceus]|jgi:hypothetical protein|uniref:Uncharacterized protein n=1 Tax=Coprinellus micaceus TaxID=71717 RepID=A0A4Y7S631_COPMI|nr:hypothetical protein FA13DRAFT_812945 [Coprinellus micaceus]